LCFADRIQAFVLRGLRRTVRFGITNSYDAFGRLRQSISTMGGATRTLTSDYDTGSRRDKVTYPDNVYFTAVFDGAARPRWILENGGTTVAQFNFDPLGRRADRFASNAVTVTTYDAISRLSTLSNDLAGTAADLGTLFGYNPASQIVSRDENNPAYASTADSPAQSYAVNGLNQYASVGGVAYGHDLNGRTTQSYTFSSIQGRDRLPRASHRLSYRRVP
jgi:hypothetical protein